MITSVVQAAEDFLSQCGSSTATRDSSLQDYLISRLESLITNLEALMQCIGDNARVRQVRRRACEYLHRFQHGERSTSQSVAGINLFNVTQHSGRRGRPLIVLNIEQVELLRSAGFTWQEVAKAIGVSRTTLWRRLSELNINTSAYTDISDHDLDEVMTTTQHNYPNAGLVILQGLLVSEGVHVQRQRLRDSVTRTDPIRRIARWHQVLSRRTYCVPRPNSLWHIDGHHSLFRWRFIIHGGIDGYSRMIVFLRCTTNNKAESVFSYFWSATREFGTPSRVRSDKGGENMKVCYFMVSQRGPARGSHIAGPSTHNQQIERLWRDVYRCVASTYHELFYYMEAQELLEPENELDLFVLHCVFLPRINRSLESFVAGWNYHPLRTERMWTPRKIWMNGMIRANCEGAHQLQDVADPTPSDLEKFGVDPNGPLPESHQQVLVPETVCPLDATTRQLFLDSLGCGDAPDDYGVQAFCTAKNYLDELLQTQVSSESDSN